VTLEKTDPEALGFGVMKRYRTLAEFYPFYLGEHSNRTCRRLHFVGSTIALALLVATAATGRMWLFPLALVQGYGLAWTGHFFYEHNRPPTFKYPWLSFRGDWRMWRDMLTGKIPF
jgi:hypothetical protein